MLSFFESHEKHIKVKKVIEANTMMLIGLVFFIMLTRIN